ncbi:unnamed protein product [Bursaphelenchus okinawaensis]|uniref:Uncharacterized protein n=1 Tax=Bursaphelenchus okinawaensis TaxID=465554 RepID=A0A811JQE9_9BILA|nr:unnamed protein product [Bursaphelenchus okinawaensis]CAG9078085.1 unnamed protein product [Bursaphelenchus okinawaensis]
MLFDAQLLQKIVGSNVLKARPDQVICATFLSFKRDEKSIVRSSTSVCPHYASDTTEDNFTLRDNGVINLTYVFSLKNINNLYVYGNKSNGHVVVDLNGSKPLYRSYSLETKFWMVGDALLTQTRGIDVKFYYGEVGDVIEKMNFFNEEVLGSVDNGDLWFPNGTCLKFERDEGNKTIIPSDCSSPNKLMLSFAALKAQNATLDDDEATVNNFAIVFYEQAPATTTTTTTRMTTEPTTTLIVTDVDVSLPEESSLAPTPIETEQVTNDSSGASLWLNDGFGLGGALLLAIVVATVAPVFCPKKEKADPVNSSKSRKTPKKSRLASSAARNNSRQPGYNPLLGQD